MSKNRGYSNEFQLSVLPAGACCLDGLISEVHYADGTRRAIGYDAEGVVNRYVDIDGSIWSREAGTNLWNSTNGASFFGTIEVVRSGSRDGVAGSISIRIMEGAFVVTERILFPIGISVESHFTRDRQERERHVHLLNGKELTFRREGRNSLWFGPNGRPAADLPENPFHYATPWRYPAVAGALA